MTGFSAAPRGAAKKRAARAASRRVGRRRIRLFMIACAAARSKSRFRRCDFAVTATRRSFVVGRSHFVGHGWSARGCLAGACYYFGVTKKRISPAKGFSGVLLVPGDKSISHRYAILASLAEGSSEIFSFSAAADCRSTLECLRGLGVRIEGKKGSIVIEGKGLGGWKAPRKALDAENSGTTMRLLAGALSGQEFRSGLTGDKSLRRRPMRRVMEPLRQMGAEIRARDDEFAPLEIQGRKLRAIEYAPKMASAQLKSVLLAGLFADGETVVHEPVRTRDHTEIALRELG